MSNITINFETLKFNLYEVLGIDSNASETKIKKAFRNLILNFHPDKNNNAEEEIYYHIITANQILTNNDNRKKYDEFLNNLQDTHNDLKTKFNKTKQIITKKIDDQKIISTELNNISNINSTIEAYAKIIKEREKLIDIPKEDITTNDDFNIKFEDKIFNENYLPEKMELSTINDNYTSIDVAFNNLYVEGEKINTSKFSSLDVAFKIQPIDTKNFKEVDIKKAIETYKTDTTILSSINFLNKSNS